MSVLTKPEAAFKEALEEMEFTVKFFEDKADDDDETCIYMQVPVLSYCLDFACPQKKINIEIDGEYWHGAFMSVTASQLQRKLHDDQRDKDLQENDWIVFRIPASSLSNDRMKPRLVKYVQSLFTSK